MSVDVKVDASVACASLCAKVGSSVRIPVPIVGAGVGDSVAVQLEYFDLNRVGK